MCWYSTIVILARIDAFVAQLLGETVCSGSRHVMSGNTNFSILASMDASVTRMLRETACSGSRHVMDAHGDRSWPALMLWETACSGNRNVLNSSFPEWMLLEQECGDQSSISSNRNCWSCQVLTDAGGRATRASISGSTEDKLPATQRRRLLHNPLPYLLPPLPGDTFKTLQIGKPSKIADL